SSRAGVRVNHVVERGNFTIRIGQNREIHFGVLRFVDVLDPLLMGFGIVHRNGDHLDITLGELARDNSGIAKLGGADRSEVGGVREQYPPTVAQILMESNAADGGILFEIGSGVSQTQCSHEVSLIRGWQKIILISYIEIFKNSFHIA